MFARPEYFAAPLFLQKNRHGKTSIFLRRQARLCMAATGHAYVAGRWIPGERPPKLIEQLRAEVERRSGWPADRQRTGRAIHRSLHRAPAIQAPLWNDISSLPSRQADGTGVVRSATRQPRGRSERTEADSNRRADFVKRSLAIFGDPPTAGEEPRPECLPSASTRR